MPCLSPTKLYLLENQHHSWPQRTHPHILPTLCPNLSIPLWCLCYPHSQACRAGIHRHWLHAVATSTCLVPFLQSKTEQGTWSLYMLDVVYDDPWLWPVEAEVGMEAEAELEAEVEAEVEALEVVQSHPRTLATPTNQGHLYRLWKLSN